MQSRSLFALFVLFGSFLLLPLSPIQAGAEDNNGAFVDGAGFTLYSTESIKGSGSDKVEQDPVCGRSKRPKIFKVQPDEAKPGQKVTITGENFGSKECFLDQERERREPPWGDPSFRTLSAGMDPSEVDISHLHISAKDAIADMNILLPIQRFAELVAEGRVGSLAAAAYSFMGYQGFPAA